jgi:pyruvate, water dikinase
VAKYILKLDEIGKDDIDRVGGKNASLGEILATSPRAGVHRAGGFATTADALRAHLAQGGLAERIKDRARRPGR